MIHPVESVANPKGKSDALEIESVADILAGATAPGSSKRSRVVPARHASLGTTGQSAGEYRCGIMQMRGPNEPGQQFTAEETIFLRGLAKGNTVKQIARLLRLPRESLFRVLGDLRNKTGMLSDTALAVWALRNVGSLDRRSAERW
jgi:DNA-binding NarL/FixJ family response regulator